VPSGVPNYNRRNWHWLGDEASSPHNSPFSNGDTWQKECPGADEGISTNSDGSGLQRPVGVAKFMGAGAEVGLLGYDGSMVDHHISEAIGVTAIPKAGPVVKSQIPWMFDSGTLVNEGGALDGGAEGAQNHQTPGIKRLRGPQASKGPNVFPEQKAQTIGESPGAGITARLDVGMTLQDHGDSCPCSIPWKHATKALTMTLGR